ncbi:hypothetical protein [Roseisolibacter agri]|uniref:hypothetical protein n=1 Tax=Roseisolibacter agri TaxID=2014610 RepID=UPI0024E06105|nr:hypothetical protein [Roseisolibacter agri]
MSDPETLARHYAAAPDEELREARRLGPEAFRPEAWRVIQSELGRRQLRRVRERSPAVARPRGASRSAPEQGWTPGLLVGLAVAVLAVAGTLRLMIRGPVYGGRGSAQLLVLLFFIVWFGTALIVDWRRWWPGRR